MAVHGLLGSRGIVAPVRHSVDLLAVAVLVPLVIWLLPAAASTIPSDVPADLIWDFRLASLAQQATMWAVLACVFGLLQSRRSAAAREVQTAAR
jgi:predicted cobalt transporter CbtA